MEEHGPKYIMIQSIRGCPIMVVGQRTRPDEWLVVLCHPLGEEICEFGKMTHLQFMRLWPEIPKMYGGKDLSPVELIYDIKGRLTLISKNNH